MAGDDVDANLFSGEWSEPVSGCTATSHNSEEKEKFKAKVYYHLSAVTRMTKKDHDKLMIDLC